MNKFFMVKKNPEQLSDNIWDCLRYLDEEEVERAFTEAGLVSEITEEGFYSMLTLYPGDDEEDYLLSGEVYDQDSPTERGE